MFISLAIPYLSLASTSFIPINAFNTLINNIIPSYIIYDNYKNYRFSGPDWYFFEHDASKPYPYGYSVKSLTQKKQEFAEWLKKYEEKA